MALKQILDAARCLRYNCAVRNAEFLTAEEVASRLSVHRVTVYRWAREGELTAVKLGPRVVRFRPADVDAFIERRAS